jgi:DNA-binding response OmpR family regulator
VDGSDVDRVAWPRERERRQELAAAGRPRLLLVESASAPPVTADDLEDWVRLPAPPDDVEARVLGLLRRVEAREAGRPRIDHQGVLRHGDTWVALPPVEARLARTMLGRLGAVVSRAALERSGWPDGTPARNTLDVHVHRLRRRLTDVSLKVRTVRARGYLLEIG